MPTPRYRGENPVNKCRACLPLLLFAVLTTGPLVAGNLFAASDEQAQAAAGSLPEMLDATLAEIDELQKTIASLETRLGQSEGLMKEVTEIRLGKSRMDLMQRNLKFARGVTELKADSAGTANYRELAVEVLQSQVDLARTIATGIKQRIEIPDAGAPAAEQAAANSRIFDLLRIYDKAYGIFIDGIDVARGFGIDVSELESKIRADLADRAATGSALLDLSASRMKTMRAGLAAVPGDQELKARLSVTTRNVTELSAILGEVLRLMERMKMNTSEYRQQLLIVTGQITSDIFDVGFVSALVVGWGRTLWENLIESGPGLVFKLILFFLLIYVFIKLAGLVQRLTERTFANAQRQPSQLLQRIVLMVVRNVIVILGVLVALAQIGISLGPLLAGLGVAGFIVGFALQDTLSNFASGLMILIYRPFDVDDFVEAAGISGKVSDMSLVNTTILTFDNQTIIVPNSKIWGDVIRNVTAQRTRRVDLVFGISYGDDIPKAEKILQEIVDSHESVLDDPAPMIRVHELGDSSVNLIVRPWVKTEDYWETYWSMTRAVKMRFDEEGITIPFPQRDVHLYQA